MAFTNDEVSGGPGLSLSPRRIFARACRPRARAYDRDETTDREACDRIAERARDQPSRGAPRPGDPAMQEAVTAHRLRHDESVTQAWHAMDELGRQVDRGELPRPPIPRIRPRPTRDVRHAVRDGPELREMHDEQDRVDEQARARAPTEQSPRRRRR